MSQEITNNEVKMRIAVSGVKKETIATNKKFSKFIKFLKNFGSVKIILKLILFLHKIFLYFYIFNKLLVGCFDQRRTNF